MPNCTDCQVKKDGRDPGECVKNGCIYYTNALGTEYSKHQPIEQEGYCDECVSCIHMTRDANNMDCLIERCEFEQRVCGNCGEHDKEDCFDSKLPKSMHPTNEFKCTLTKGYTGVNCEAGILGTGGKVTCQWKPIIPPCPTCGGTGEVCKYCDRTKKPTKYCYFTSGISWQQSHGHKLIPCPTCSTPPEKVEEGEKLMLPVEWTHNEEIGVHYLGICTGHALATIHGTYTGWCIDYGCGQLGNILGHIIRIESFDTLNQAKTAVHKALGIKGGEK